MTLSEETVAEILAGNDVVKDSQGHDCRVMWRPVRDSEGRVVAGDPVLERIK